MPGKPRFRAGSLGFLVAKFAFKRQSLYVRADRAAAYLSAAAEDGAIDEFMIALRAVAEAHGAFL
jgi:hypothetical protein